MKSNPIDSKKIDGQKRRGKIIENDLKPFINYSYEESLLMLRDFNAQKRTIAIKLLEYQRILENIEDSERTEHFENSLGSENKNNYENRIIHEIIQKLIEMFQKEKALYTRIAISESLESYGRYSIPYLIAILGRIGNNQEKELPTKYFNKKNFPLQRDLASRTLVKIGKISTPFLIEVLDDNEEIYDNSTKEQAIDAIGGIAYKYNDHKGLNSLINLSYKEIDNEMIQWKIVRALSGYKNNQKALNQVINILKNYYLFDKDKNKADNKEDNKYYNKDKKRNDDKNNEYKNVVEIQWEAIRSIDLIGIRNEETKEILNSFKENENKEIQTALKELDNQ